MSDRELVRAALAGDRTAFAILVERHRPLLVATCRRLLGASELVDEAVQEAVLQALLGLDRLRDQERFGSWLAGIGLNVGRRLLRRPAPGPWPVETGADPQDVVEAAEVASWVRRAVAALPCGQREAVTLFYLDGLSQREVARALGIEVGAVKGRLHKARRALRSRLVELMEAHVSETGAKDGIAVAVVDVQRRTAPDGESRHLVVLQEVGGERRLRLWIGQHEAEMLAVHLEDLEMVRPLTYTFAARLLEAGGGALEEVRISRLADETYYAEALVSAGGTTRAVDARPSDALNLAVLLGRPVKVAPEVLSAAGAAAEPATGEEHSAAEIVDDLLGRLGPVPVVRRRG